MTLPRIFRLGILNLYNESIIIRKPMIMMMGWNIPKPIMTTYAPATINIDKMVVFALRPISDLEVWKSFDGSSLGESNIPLEFILVLVYF